SHNVIRKLKQQFYSRRISQASFAYQRYQHEIEKAPREDDKRKTYKDRIEGEDLLKKIQDKMKFYKILIIPVNSLNGAELALREIVYASRLKCRWSSAATN
ncbi:MAG: hypothetical protein JNM63_00225, partial [Spirochaetia bacterium]|nr:hypothetical protein [Spirochaetia bacterium]